MMNGQLSGNSTYKLWVQGKKLEKSSKKERFCVSEASNRIIVRTSLARVMTIDSLCRRYGERLLLHYFSLFPPQIPTSTLTALHSGTSIAGATISTNLNKQSPFLRNGLLYRICNRQPSNTLWRYDSGQAHKYTFPKKQRKYQQTQWHVSGARAKLYDETDFCTESCCELNLSLIPFSLGERSNHESGFLS